MANDVTWMLAMNETARAFGDGLKPELEKLLLRQVRQAAHGAVPIDAVDVSAGPKHQFATPEQLTAAGIPTLSTYRSTDKQTNTSKPTRA